MSESNGVLDLLARQQIDDLVHRFADAVTRKDIESCRDLLTTDADLVITNWETFRGREGILDGLTALVADWEQIIFTNHSGIVTVDGDRATGQWYLREFGIKLGKPFDITGVYHDVYAKADGTWRFAWRRYDTLHICLDGETSVFPFPDDLPTTRVAS